MVVRSTFWRFKLNISRESRWQEIAVDSISVDLSEWQIQCDRRKGNPAREEKERMEEKLVFQFIEKDSSNFSVLIENDFKLKNGSMTRRMVIWHPIVNLLPPKASLVLLYFEDFQIRISSSKKLLQEQNNSFVYFLQLAECPPVFRLVLNLETSESEHSSDDVYPSEFSLDA